MNSYEQFIKEKKACYLQERQQLEAQDRRDEANFCLVRANICDAFEQVWQAVSRREKTQAEAVTAYRHKLETIPSAWRTRRQEADAHGDVQTAAIEEIKLETVRMLAEEFEKRVKEEAL